MGPGPNDCNDLTRREGEWSPRPRPIRVARRSTVLVKRTGRRSARKLARVSCGCAAVSRPRPCVKSRYVPDTFCSVPIRHSMGGLLGGVGAAGSAAGVGEGAVLAGAVVSDGV